MFNVQVTTVAYRFDHIFYGLSLCIYVLLLYVCVEVLSLYGESQFALYHWKYKYVY